MNKITKVKKDQSRIPSYALHTNRMVGDHKILLVSLPLSIICLRIVVKTIT